VAVLGISRDPPAAQKRWKEKNDLPFPLLSDADTRVQQSYGVWKEKNMYGRKVMGTVRTTLLVDPEGKVEKVFSKVKVDGHVDDVLASL